MKSKIIIIGGGISGITTALTLQLLGFETTCYSEHFVEADTPDDPRFASLYPAASVIPHSVFSNQSEKLFSDSQSVFELLLCHQTEGIKEHLHFELYEFEKDDPSYANSLKNYQRIEDTDPDELQIPTRITPPALHGWKFNCIVAEWPTYISILYEWYQKVGGQLVQEKIDADKIKDLNSDAIINCTGIWSSELFEDPNPLEVVKGHLLYVHDADLFRDNNGHIPSYNYTPLKEIYADPKGNPCDVYCYPRSTGLALGGSRQPGIVDKAGSFEGDENQDVIEIGGLDIPRQIYELNKEILLETYGLDLSNYSSLKAKTGYRYTRSSDGDGLRLETSEEHGKKIIHNYGHGGAGVTLSWGCALHVANQLINYSLPDLESRLKRFLDS